jgi:tetratricopeptide (TPR) repeat protein
MHPFALVTGGDSNFFPLLQDLIRSIRDKPQGQEVPIYVLDAGLTEPHRDWLAQQQARTVTIPWPYPLEAPAPQRMLAIRCMIPTLLPEHRVYIWLDADTWVQDWEAIEVYARVAENEQFCLAAEVDRSFNAAGIRTFQVNASTRLYGKALADRMADKPLLNAGVFAGRRDAPHWTAWRRRVEQALVSSKADFFLDQTALNVIAYVDGLHVACLPARYNWVCHMGMPRTSADGKVLLEPQPPYEKIGILHLASWSKQHKFVLRAQGGGLVYRSLHYSAEPANAINPADPAPAAIALAFNDCNIGRPDRALHQLRLLASASPQNPQVLATLAQVAAICGQHGESVRALRGATAIRPDDAALHARLGDAYLKQNRNDEAEAALRRATELSPQDEQARGLLKTAREGQEIPPGDYVSPGLVRVVADRFFPNMKLGDPQTVGWPYLRRNSPHNWYVDSRAPQHGFVSRDEAHILFNLARQFEGRTALEIGCLFGFSACHLAFGGVQLDVLDPLLANPIVMDSVSTSLMAAGVLDSCRLIPDPSPSGVQRLAQSEGKRWSLVFIDGNHEGDAPRYDAQACEPFLERDAAVIFHDLLSPYVAAGLRYFSERGWKTRIYRTSQLMGVAWRGNFEPIKHVPDPALPAELPAHLADLAGSLAA